jgi:threonine/homoserine/homoserine lactone efflux protein
VADLLLSVLPYCLAAAAAAPAAAVVTALILAESARPLVSAWTFTAGAALLDVVLMGIALALAGATGYDGGGDAGAIVDVVLGALFLALGIFAVFSHETPEKEAAQRERMQRAARGGVGAMVTVGLVVQVVNFDAIAVFGGALKEVIAADVSAPEATVAVAFALVVMLVPYWGPAALYAISARRAGPMLRRMSGWILAHSRPLEIWVGLLFGVSFLFKGLQRLG